MIDKKFVKKILRDVLNRNRSLEDHNLMHPEREWLTGLCLATITVGVGVFWCIHIYNTYSKVEIDTEAVNISDQTIYREHEVAESLKDFASRQAKYKEIRKNLETSQKDSLPISPIEVTATEMATGTLPTVSTSSDETIKDPLTDTDQDQTETIPAETELPIME